jgi:triacylglycerol lipase
MIPFDGQFAENYVYPLALGAYDATQPPPGYAAGTTAFEILADTTRAGYTTQFARSSLKHKKMMQSMLDQPRRPMLTSLANATNAQLLGAQRSAQPNQHFGWVCVDTGKSRLVVAFRGTEFFHDWLDDFDFIAAPYAPIPGCGTVHQGFQLVYSSVRDNVRQLVQTHGTNCTEILITGHSLGGALAGISAPDLLNDVAANLSPIVYTFAEPRVGHSDFVHYFDTHVNVCYHIANVWDVVPHLPPVLALYEHEGNSVTIDSGFSLDIVKNHVLVSGYAPGLARWNQEHVPQATRHFGTAVITTLVGKTV